MVPMKAPDQATSLLQFIPLVAQMILVTFALIA